ncbi:histone lysine methyltransferase Set9 [Dipsacomyces acuminosporus]|nr:histone lysine methyltransferase Set9 [Dipsacomyces acuminosporus]
MSNSNPTSVSTMDALTLSKYDDLLIEILLDQVGLWFKTRKMFKRHRHARSNQPLILDIVKRVSRGEARLLTALEELLADEYISAFLRHKSELRLKDFRIHAERYLSMYLPDAGYEIGQTDRYRTVTGKTEARIVATKRYTLGNVIGLCSGSIAVLDDEEIKRLEEEGEDFSVMWWNKKQSMCLFLGPARFVNHDCDSNCRFTPLGNDAIGFQALKTIEPGEEITTHYGFDYFGEGNCECLCATCEKFNRGWYAKNNKDSSNGSSGSGSNGNSSSIVELQVDGSLQTPVDTDTESNISTAAANGGNSDIRMRTRNKGRKSLPNVNLFLNNRLMESFTCNNYNNKYNDKGEPLCATCGDLYNITKDSSKTNKTLFGTEDVSLIPDVVAAITMKGKRRPRLLCYRCSRHEFLFNLPWPDRKPPKPAKSKKKSSKSAKRKKDGDSEDSQKKLKAAEMPKPPTIFDGPQGPLTMSVSEMFSSLAIGTPVFIDPLDSNLEYWWPAVVVDSFVEDNDKKYQVRYFEDGSYSQCSAGDLVLFDPVLPPFADWLQNKKEFLNDMATRRALAYYEWRFLAAHSRLVSTPKPADEDDPTEEVEAEGKREGEGENGAEASENTSTGDDQTELQGLAILSSPSLLPNQDAGSCTEDAGSCTEAASSGTEAASITPEEESAKASPVINITSNEIADLAPPTPSTTVTITNSVSSSGSNSDDGCNGNGSGNEGTRKTGVNEAYKLKQQYQTELLLESAAAKEKPELLFDDFFTIAAAATIATTTATKTPGDSDDVDKAEAGSEAGTDSMPSRDATQCILPYLHQLKDQVHVVDERDGKCYFAKITDIDFINNSERFGIYYYVHYKGWNPKFDEWVPPSRIVYKS